MHLLGFALTGLVGLIALAIFLIASVFWIFMLIDIVRRRFSSDLVKIIWLLVVFFSHICGGLLYFFFGRSTGSLD